MTQKPETVNELLDLLAAVVAQARAEAFAVPETLQASLWLIYRILDHDFRCVEAYLNLAYLFCLLQDWVRAGQILLHADRLQPGNSAIQNMLTQIRFTLKQPVPVVSATTRSEPLKPLQTGTSLPRLDTLREQVAQDRPEDLQARYLQLRPVLNQLARRLWEGEVT